MGRSESELIKMAEKVVGNTTYEGDFVEGEKSLVCVCGNDKFKMQSHMDMTDRAISAYQCVGCGRIITATYMRNTVQDIFEV